MGVLLHQCHSWPAVSQHLAQWIADLECGVFEVPRLVTGSPGAARLVSQELAPLLPTGISAGIQFLSLKQWVRALSQQYGVADALQPWHPSRLPLHVWQEIEGLAACGQHPALARHLGGQDVRRPRRPMALARRVSRLLRTYIDEAPQMVTGWLEGQDLGPHQDPLAPHDAWQPALLRRLVESLGSNPLEAQQRMLDSLASGGTQPVGFVGIAHASTLERRLIQAAASTQEVPVWHLGEAAGHEWAALLQPATTTSCRTSQPQPPPSLEVHGSHDEARQVQVLRDALSHAFHQDPTLEPRQVVVVTPDVQRWAPYLREAFSPSDDPLAHPGRTLRLEAPGQGELANEVLDCLADLLGMADSRATGPDLLRLLLSTPIAHRWRFDHERLVRLLSDAQVRWGLDAAHRSGSMLDQVTQNTWTRGIDRLLLSVPMGGQDAGLEIIGVGTTSTTDVDTIGALSEVLSRIRRFVAQSASPATPAQWAARLLDLAGDVMDPPWADAWMLSAATALLTEFAASTDGVTTTLTRSQFAGLFQELIAEVPRRARVGNGAIHLVAPGELHPVSHRVVAFLGISDHIPGPEPDDVSGHTATRRALRLEALVDQGRSADHVIMVYPSRTVTNAPLARPTTLDWLAQRITGQAQLEVTPHASSARDQREFNGPRPSFDAAAARVVNRRGSGAGESMEERRRLAMSRPDVPAQPDPLRPHEIPAFLRDTAAAFLRHAGGLRLWEEPRLESELPINVSALDEWAALDALLAAIKRGESRDDAMRQAALTETLPPGNLGHDLVRQWTDDVGELWQAASHAWNQPAQQLPVDCQGVRGTVTTRGGRVVHLGVGASLRSLVAPWVDLLCLSAMGQVTTAHVHQFDRIGYEKTRVPSETVLHAPGTQEARRLLGQLVRAVHVGRHRLLPMPLEPALKLLENLSQDTYKPSEWAALPQDWGSAWRYRGVTWHLFYDGPADELFDAPPQPADQLPPAREFGAFGGWARALLEPMLQARGGEPG